MPTGKMTTKINKYNCVAYGPFKWFCTRYFSHVCERVSAGRYHCTRTTIRVSCKFIVITQHGAECKAHCTHTHIVTQGTVMYAQYPYLVKKLNLLSLVRPRRRRRYCLTIECLGATGHCDNFARALNDVFEKRLKNVNRRSANIKRS